MLNIMIWVLAPLPEPQPEPTIIEQAPNYGGPDRHGFLSGWRHSFGRRAVALGCVPTEEPSQMTTKPKPRTPLKNQLQFLGVSFLGLVVLLYP